MIIWILLSIAAGIDGSSNPRGNQLPPPNTAYAALLGECGMENVCDGAGGPGCFSDRRRKRSADPLCRNSTSGDDYVRNGADVFDYNMPWVANFQEEGGIIIKEWKTFCTGALISSRHVITAKHCLNADIETYGTSYEYVDKKKRILFGRQGSNPPPTEARITRLHIPPKKVGHHDIMLVEFEDITFSAYVRPICLPIHGLPKPPDLVYAGYGLSGSLCPFSKVETGKKKFLQKLSVFGLNDVDMEKPATIGHKNMKFAAWNAQTNPVTSHMIVTLRPGKPKACMGDSGGPWMWKNPATGRYILAGVMSGVTGTPQCHPTGKPTKTTQKVFVMKVTTFLDWIVKRMLNMYGNIGNSDMYTYCLDRLCRGGDIDKNLTRTWVMKLQTDGNQAVERLAAPCQFSREGQGVMCPIDGQLNHSRIVAVRSGHGYRYCQKCANMNRVTPDWDSSLYADEFTLGSFTQPTYNSIESPAEEILKIVPNLDRSHGDPYHNTCQMDTVDTKISCPKMDPIDNDQCILPESICDGYEDCDNGWDESPHLCIGKCDFWKQYQFPDYAYSTDWHSKNNVEWSAYTLISPKDCSEACRDDNLSNFEKPCTHWNWFFDKKVSGAGRCILFFGEPEDHKHSNIKNLEVDDITPKYSVRGPKVCPMKSKSQTPMTLNPPVLKGGTAWNNIRDCSPTIGAPYRRGIFLIQAFNGMFLYDQHYKAGNQIPEQHNIQMGSNTLEVLATLNRTTYGDPARGEDFFTDARGEWIFNFFGNKDNLYDSYFTISTGYSTGPKSKDNQDKYITVKANSWQMEEGKHQSVTDESSEQFSQKWEVRPTVHQHIYMKPTRRERGFTEVKLYAKREGENYFLTVPPYDGAEYPEYHWRLHVNPNLTRHQMDNNHHKLIIEKELTDDKGVLRQTFRIFECEYGLSTGSRFRGIQRGSDVYSGFKVEKDNLKKYLTNAVKIPFDQKGTRILVDLFGQTREQVKLKMFEGELAESYLLTQISGIMAGSGSIFDYAGRMRLKPEEFRIMFEAWSLLISSRQDYVKDPYGQELYDYVKGRGVNFMRGDFY